MLSYVLVFYVSPGEAWWSAEVPDLRWSLLAAVVTITAVIRYPAPSDRPPWHKTPFARWLAVITLWLWVQTLWALDIDNHVFLASLFSKYLLLYAALYTCLSEPRNVRQFYFAHILGCFLWGYIAYQSPGSGRLETIGTGDVAGSAFASMQIGTGIIFAGFAFLGASGIHRWLAFSSIPFMLNAIVLMATRGAFVGLLGGALAAVFFAPRSKRYAVILSIAISPILLTMLANDLFWSRMFTILPSGNSAVMEASADSRFGIAKANLEMFLDHPMGVGHRGNEILSPTYMPPSLLTEKGNTQVRSAHNTFMAILVDHGAVGLFLFLMLHLSIFRSLLRLKLLPSSGLDTEFSFYAAALGTAWVVYWGNAQFANFTKSEVIIWIAVLASALEWMMQSSLRTAVTTPSENEPSDGTTKTTNL